MTDDPRGTRLWTATRSAVGSARFAQALTLIAVGLAFSTHAIVALIGWPGLLAALATLIVLSGLSLVARWRAVEWYGILPLTILVFLAWCAASVIWSDTSWLTATRVAYLIAFAVLGVYIALMRDTIQIVRAFADVMRVLLGVSLGLEILSGILLDLPIAFLGITGDLARLGPVQGIFGTRNMLGFVALIALLTFIVEWRTKISNRAKAFGSMALAGICVVLSGSPTTWISLGAALVALAALYGLRRAQPATRWRWQIGLLSAGFVILVVAWLLRLRIIELLDARAEFDVRLDVWREASRYLAVNPLQGWGWYGEWPDRVPFVWVEQMTGRDHASALSAYIDVYFQVGVIGLLLFAALILVALVRAWLLASSRRSPVYLWPALMLVVIAVTSFAESFAITEGGWMLLVVCAVKAARDMSWRDALSRPGVSAPATGERL
ncbi:exopolysaccharide production protein [Agromyces sp. CFH 90414]|uniref:Exopolysaccharide production protein n=1 Tax=Agromyces agglutinans TaxID=2662258 RepID=A0A6I2FDJ7_9MICO|nr:O-antigen ligase family protein [Agromyces agglutinans]MRG60576.1 exopolysaccharide production protein [Agromyces agglutinans]